MQDASAVKTKKLYYENAYENRFTANVVSVSGNDVVLDATAFFPEEGGQEADTGVLAGYPVTDVQIRDGEIHHFLDMPEGHLSAGDAVSGELDWERRFSNMQQHSGEHLFSGIVHRRYGFDNVGFHLSGREVTLDFSGSIPPKDLPEIEAEVNRAITADIETRIRFLDGEEKESTEYRSKLDLSGEVRLVEFPGIDACACCAPHVRRTGEIGLLKVVSMINWKGGVRVSILCGGRALAFLREEHDIVTRSANYLTTSASEIFPQIQRMKEEIAALKSEKAALLKKLLMMQAEAVPADAENAVLFTEEADAKTAREIVNELAAHHAGCAAVFIGNDASGYSYVIGSRNKDVREVCAIFRENFGGKGGGKPEMAQGSVSASKDAVLAVLDAE